MAKSKLSANLKISAMDLKKTVIAIMTCAVVSTVAFAQKTYKLPKAHRMIAEDQIEANYEVNSPFLTQSVDDVCKNSPFADMYNAAKSAAPMITALSTKAGKMVDYASRFLGTRYVLGANGPRAFDCSGFTSYVYKNFGITLNRCSRDQYRQGEKVSVSNLRPGDLLFFSCRSSGRGNVGHVAMVVSVDRAAGTCQFIHASVRKGVTYQKFPDNGYYSRNFIGARRILGTSLDRSSDLAKN